MTKNVLCYTVAFDLNESSFFRQQVRMLVSSLCRSGFQGDIKVVHSSEFEIFGRPRISVEEIRIDPPVGSKDCCREQSSWNRLLLDTKFSLKPLTNPSVEFLYDKRDFLEMLNSPMLHFCGCDHVERMLAMQAKFLSNFHTDVDGSLIGMLEG